METFFYLSLLLTFLGVTLAATGKIDYSHPDHPGKCYINPCKILSPGIHKNVNGCSKFHCMKTGMVNFETCGKQGIPDPKCHLGEPMGITYPECCHRKVICRDNRGKEYFYYRIIFPNLLDELTPSEPNRPRFPLKFGNLRPISPKL